MISVRSELATTAIRSLESIRRLSGRPRPASLRALADGFRHPVVIEEAIETGAALGGRYRLELRSDGTCTFSGRIEAGGFTSHRFTLLVRLTFPFLAADGSMAEADHVFARAGEVFGHLEGGSAIDRWDHTVALATPSAWAGLRRAHHNRDFQYGSSLGVVSDLAESIGKLIVASATLGAVGAGLVLASSAASSLDLDELVLPGLVGVIAAGGACYVLGPGAVYPAFAGASGTAVAAGEGLQRRLSEAEIAEVEKVFHRSIDVRRVMLTRLTGVGGRPFVMPTHGDTILVNIGEDRYEDPLQSDPGGLIHEMTHVWQIQNTSFSPGYYCQAWATAAHSTVGEDVSDRIYATGSPGRRWEQYGVESQASIVEQWYLGTSVHGPPAPMSEQSPWFPLIRDHLRPGRD